jgi:hypothetical protein
MRLAIWASAILQGLGFLFPAWGADAGDRLQWTGAVTQVEGSAGGGLVPWALIGGLETDAEVGATGFATYVSTETSRCVPAVRASTWTTESKYRRRASGSTQVQCFRDSPWDRTSSA